MIIDDHRLLRQGLERLLDSTDEFVVCGEAGNAQQGILVVRKEKPDAVIIDICLPDMDGIALTKKLIGEFPELPIVILSMHEESLYAQRAREAGAVGYIVKSEAIEKLQVALRDAIRGRATFPPRST